MKIGIVSGYFALGLSHCGHVDLINAVLDRSDDIAVIVNNNYQTEKKYGFIPVDDYVRLEIIDELPHADQHSIRTFLSIDDDESVAKTIEKVVKYFREDGPTWIKSSKHEFTFYNSGDRNSSNANPKEVEVCQRLGVSMEYLDLPKRGSSSDLIKKIKARGIYEYKEQKHYENIERSIYH